MKEIIIKMFSQNSKFIKNLLSNLHNEDMLLSTGDSNTIAWIFGHILYSRQQIKKVLNNLTEIPEAENIFKRGVAKNKLVQLDLETSMNKFLERGEEIINEIEKISDDGLKRKISGKLPFGGDDIESFLSALVWHETFHLGQIDLIIAAGGKGGIK
ncbi:MAG: DinB family protein [Ignavibacteriaceae bacterium]|nr:DinB family protein [Ignavibacteriaceae bacterium]